MGAAHELESLQTLTTNQYGLTNAISGLGLTAARASAIEKNRLCRLCRLKIDRFDQLLSKPRFRLDIRGKRILKRLSYEQTEVLRAEFRRA